MEHMDSVTRWTMNSPLGGRDTMKNVYSTDRPFQLLRLLMVTISVVICFFLIASFISIVKKDYLYIGQVDQTIQIAPTEMLVKLFAFENQHFNQVLTEDQQTLPITSTIFKMVTNLNFDDIRSLIGNELPGYAFYDSKIIVAGEGTDYTTLPIESAPPIEVLLQEREMAEEQLKELKEEETARTPLAPMQKKMFIYHTHSSESYLPLLGLSGDPDENKAFDSKTNITIIGEMFAKKLESYNIGVVLDQTNMGQLLRDKGWSYYKSYDLSREIAQSAIATNNDLEYFIDLHRDAKRKEETTVTINSNPYARIMFVIGKGHSNYDKNLAFATALHEALNDHFPGLSRGVIEKGTDAGNGIYNQDLSSKALTVEVGGVDNDITELQNTVDALAKVISDFYWEAEKVDADG
jgi:stage II sporulation protein P